MNTEEVKSIVELRDKLGLLYQKKQYEKDLRYYKMEHDRAVREASSQRENIIAVVCGIIFATISFLIINAIFKVENSIYGACQGTAFVLNQIVAAILGLGLGFGAWFLVSIFVSDIFEKKLRAMGEFDPMNSPRYKKVNKEYCEFVADLEIKDLESLKAQFREILDFSDWAYIDRIIYCFVSHRADNLKEALLQVDEYKRHNEIMQSLNQINCSLQEIKRWLEEIKIELGAINSDLLGRQATIAISSAQIIEEIRDNRYLTSGYRPIH